MIALRNTRTVHARRGLGLTIAATMLCVSCGDAARFLVILRELQVVQQQVGRVAGTNDVSVNLQNGRVLAITLGNSAVSGNPGADRRERLRQIASTAYLAFPSRSQVEAVSVARIARERRYGLFTYSVVTESQRFRP